MAYSKSVFDQVIVILISKLHIRAFSANFFFNMYGVTNRFQSNPKTPNTPEIDVT